VSRRATAARAWIYLGSPLSAALQDAIPALRSRRDRRPRAPTRGVPGLGLFGQKDAANFKKYGGQARDAGLESQPELLDGGAGRAGEAIK